MREIKFDAPVDGEGVFFVSEKNFCEGKSVKVGPFNLNKTASIQATVSGVVGEIEVVDQKGEKVARIPLRGEIQTMELIPFLAHGDNESLIFTFHGEGAGEFISFELF